jgi:hypothetical protein
LDPPNGYFFFFLYFSLLNSWLAVDIK